MELLLNDLNDSKTLDTIFILNEYAKKYYTESHIVKKVDINSKEAKESITNFFNTLNKRNELKELILKYFEISLFNSKIDGAVYITNNSISKIEVPYFNNLFNASIGIHEYTHALNIDKNNSMNNKVEYEEILPYFNQFLYLEYMKLEKDTFKVIEDYQNWLLNEVIFYGLKNTIPLIKALSSSEGDQVLPNLENNYKYFIGSIYSLLLYDYYNMDKNLFMRKYKKLYEDKKNILDLLRYYGISLKNKENLILVKSLIKNKSM